MTPHALTQRHKHSLPRGLATGDTHTLSINTAGEPDWSVFPSVIMDTSSVSFFVIHVEKPQSSTIKHLGSFDPSI